MSQKDLNHNCSNQICYPRKYQFDWRVNTYLPPQMDFSPCPSFGQLLLMAIGPTENWTAELVALVMVLLLEILLLLLLPGMRPETKHMIYLEDRLCVKGRPDNNNPPLKWLSFNKVQLYSLTL